MIRTLLLFGCLALAVAAQAQAITMKKRLGAVVFFQEGKSLRLKEVSRHLAVNPKAAGIFQSARSSERFSAGLSVVGGGLLGWQIGLVMVGEQPQWEWVGIGGGLAVLSFPAFRSFSRKAEIALAFYNEGLPYLSQDQFRPEFYVSAFPGGVGLTMQF